MTSWEILGVVPGADRVAIKAAYFQKIKVHSPDKDPEQFKLIRKAYEELSGSASPSASTAGFRSLAHQPENIPSPHELLNKERELQTGLTVHQLIRLTFR